MPVLKSAVHTRRTSNVSMPVGHLKSASSTEKRKSQTVKPNSAEGKYKFDNDVKNWVGVSSKRSNHNSPSKWATAQAAAMLLSLKKRKSQQTFDMANEMQGQKKAHRGTSQMSVPVDEHTEEGEELTKTDTEFKFLANPEIEKPFVLDMDKLTIWSTPAALARERARPFDWERPKPSDDNPLTTIVSNQQAHMLKKVVVNKEHEIELLRLQIQKLNHENYKLLKELEGYRGNSYLKIYEENSLLKENLARVSRENIMLHGLMRQSNNRILNKRADKSKREKCFSRTSSISGE